MGLSRKYVGRKPARWEFVSVLLLICSFFAFNLATYDYFSAVWCDEVSFSEPAINKILHGAYTTTVWEFNPINTFPVVNCPLYGLSLVPWLAVSGTSLVAVRSFNYFLIGLAAYLSWMISWRFRLARTPLPRLLLVPMVHLGYGMSFAYRCSRPDILGLVCLLLLVLAFGIRRPSTRLLCLAALSAISLSIGLQIALFAIFMYVVIWIVFRRGNIRDLVCMIAGMGMAAVLLVALLYWHGVLSCFVSVVTGVINKSYGVAPSPSHSSMVVRLLKRIFVEYFEDFSMLMLTPPLILLSVVSWGTLRFTTRKLALCSLVFVFGTPVLFEVFGHFAFYYSGLQFLPAILAWSAAISDFAMGQRTIWRWCLMASAIAAIIVGLPLRLGIALACIKPTPRENIRAIIASHISSGDVAFTEYATFFEVKQVAATVYDKDSSVGLLSAIVRGQELTEEQRQQVSVLVIRPGNKENVCAFFRGDWAPVTGLFGDTQDFSALIQLPLVGKRFEHYASQPQVERFQVQIFRRVSESAAKQ
jgi:hypothetical protein